MSLTKEIRKVHNELYKTVNGNIKVLLPIALTLLEIYKSKVREGVADPIEETAIELRRTTKQVIDANLMRIQTEHPQISPLLRKTIEAHLNEIGAQPEARINQLTNYISENRRFLNGLRQEDFIGMFYETMVSSEFDKEDGRFFTPKNIILINVEVMRSLLESQKLNFSSLNICDPCCGSARFLIYWIESLRRYFSQNRFLTPETINKFVSDTYAKRLFGIDIHPEVAGYACWNMLFHGNGATNIANADSLNHYGVLVHWKLVQKFLEEFEDKFGETKRKIQRRQLQEKLEYIESKKNSMLTLRGKDEIDISSSAVMNLIDVINGMLEVHSEVPLEWWPTLQELHRLKDFDSINEIMKFQWSKINEDLKNGFDAVITNPPFGRGKNLQIDDPYILCQYKLATETWIGDLTKILLGKLIEKQFQMSVEDFYLRCLKELGVSSIEKGKLSKSAIRKKANEVLFKGKGNKKRAGEYLVAKIAEKLGREWIKIKDVFDFDHKIALKDSATGDEHAIYYDSEGKPILFKTRLPKQVLFLEQFLRMVKNGGKVFTVIDTGVLSNNEDEYVRRFLFKNSRIHAVVEFPHNAFKAAGTGVKTAVILYEKTSNPPEDYEIFGSLPQKLGYILNKQDNPPDPDHNDLGKALCDYREYVGIGRMCDKSDVECDWVTKGYCTVWRKKIEKVEEE